MTFNPSSRFSRFSRLCMNSVLITLTKHNIIIILIKITPLTKCLTIILLILSLIIVRINFSYLLLLSRMVCLSVTSHNGKCIVTSYNSNHNSDNKFANNNNTNNTPYKNFRNSNLNSLTFLIKILRIMTMPLIFTVVI